MKTKFKPVKLLKKLILYYILLMQKSWCVYIYLTINKYTNNFFKLMFFETKNTRIVLLSIIHQFYNIWPKLKYEFLSLKGFWTIVFIFIAISTTFRPICPPAFFRCLSNSGTFTELRSTSFIESMGVVCSDSVSHNRVQVLSIPVLLLACSQDWTCNLQMIVSLEA